MRNAEDNYWRYGSNNNNRIKVKYSYLRAKTLMMTIYNFVKSFLIKKVFHNELRFYLNTYDRIHICTYLRKYLNNNFSFYCKILQDF